MADDSSGQEAPTRRDYMKYGGAVVGGGLLAGCAGQSDGGSTPTETSTEESTETETATRENESYSVTMSPMGTVEFDSVPEKAVAFDPQWADHMVALGQGDRLDGIGRPDDFFHEYYDQLPGVSLDTDSLDALYAGSSYDKELLYELDADIHHMDPWRAVNTNDNFDMDDAEEIVENVGPWFANRYSRSHGDPGTDDYEYYTLWELSEKFGQVYQMPDRTDALKRVRDEMVAEIEANLPPEEDRPTVGLVVFWDQDEQWYPYQISQPGFGRAQYQPLGVKDAFDGDERSYNASYDAAYDHEGMLEIDPDVLIQNFGLTYPDEGEGSMQASVYDYIENDSVASELTAVQNERFYPGGTAFQGPIFNLFQIEIAAKQIYPDIFGEFQGVGETPQDEQLFDRQRVADIINGNI